MPNNSPQDDAEGVFDTLREPLQTSKRDVEPAWGHAEETGSQQFFQVLHALAAAFGFVEYA